jgi:hypothetical protein
VRVIIRAVNGAPLDHPGLRALAGAVQARIYWLGWTYDEINDRGGLARLALRELINARRVPRDVSIIDLDYVVGWPPGTARDVLDERIAPPEPDAWPHLPDEYGLEVVRSGLVKLTREYEDIIVQVRATNNKVYKHIEHLDAMRKARR